MLGSRGPGARGPAKVLTQSTMRILLTLSLCWSCLAAMATELKKQKPLFGEAARERETVARVQQDVSSESMSQNHHMDLRSLKGRSPDLSCADQLFNVDTLAFQNGLSHQNTKLVAFPRKA